MPKLAGRSRRSDAARCGPPAATQRQPRAAARDRREVEQRARPTMPSGASDARHARRAARVADDEQPDAASCATASSAPRRKTRAVERRACRRASPGHAAPPSAPDRHAARREVRLRLADGVLAVVEDRRDQRRARAARASSPSYRCSSVPDAARRDHRDVDRDRRPRASARGRSPPCVPSRSMLVSRISPAPAASMRAAHSTRVEPGRRAAAVREHLPAAPRDRRRRAGGRRSRRRRTARRSARTPRARTSGSRDRRRVDRHLVGAGVEQRAHVVDGAHAAADGERHEARARPCAPRRRG